MEQPMKASQNKISRALMRITSHPVAASNPKWNPKLILEKKFPHGHFLSLQRTLTHNLDGLASACSTPMCPPFNPVFASVFLRPALVLSSCQRIRTSVPNLT
jgi:hypothetical protein